MDVLTNTLYTVSNALLVPVVIAIFFFLVTTLCYIGGLTAEAYERWKRRPEFLSFLERLKTNPTEGIPSQEIPKTYGLLTKAFGQLSADHDKTLDDIQLESERLIGRLNFGIRLGPILGLAGTLIPLGPALIALSGGDITTLSSKLVVAFTTTVLGLLIGGVCFAIHSIKRQWYMQDLNDIEFIFKRIGDNREKNT